MRCYVLLLLLLNGVFFSSATSIFYEDLGLILEEDPATHITTGLCEVSHSLNFTYDIIAPFACTNHEQLIKDVNAEITGLFQSYSSVIGTKKVARSVGLLLADVPVSAVYEHWTGPLFTNHPEMREASISQVHTSFSRISSSVELVKNCLENDLYFELWKINVQRFKDKTFEFFHNIEMNNNPFSFPELLNMMNQHCDMAGYLVRRDLLLKGLNDLSEITITEIDPENRIVNLVIRVPILSINPDIRYYRIHSVRLPTFHNLSLIHPTDILVNNHTRKVISLEGRCVKRSRLSICAPDDMEHKCMTNILMNYNTQSCKFSNLSSATYQVITTDGILLSHTSYLHKSLTVGYPTFSRSDQSGPVFVYSSKPFSIIMDGEKLSHPGHQSKGSIEIRSVSSNNLLKSQPSDLNTHNFFGTDPLCYISKIIFTIFMCGLLSIIGSYSLTLLLLSRVEKNLIDKINDSRS